jgi:hypothetical protein
MPDFSRKADAFAGMKCRAQQVAPSTLLLASGRVTGAFSSKADAGLRRKMR